jgi:hypothetical protein
MKQLIGATKRMIPVQCVIIFLNALLFCSTFVHADEKKSSPLLYCVAYAPQLSSLFFKQAEDRYQTVTLSTANIIEISEAPLEAGILSLFGPADENGKHTLAASADLSTTAHPLIVLNPAAGEAQPPYTATVIDADPARFPLGSYLLVNLSPHPIRITHDKESIEIAASGTHVYQPQVAAGEALAITIDYKLEEEWVLLSSSNWSNRNDRRTLVCLIEDPASKRMTIKSIPLRPTARP